MNDISKDWKGSTKDERKAIEIILKYEGTPTAIFSFDKCKEVFSNYWYWFVLSTLWVSYSGHSDLNQWKRLFSDDKRESRLTSIMKPSELTAFNLLPNQIVAYRAHRQNETDWISYTLDKALAERWVRQRGGYLRSYELSKEDCIALFLRRGESEILMLDPKKASQNVGVDGDGNDQDES
ncbi:hypothetical protein [Paenibacillus sp. L3-i20]|uniref:hypothetical protein n=1 Tax=Paenibacillus sp. L3-i20 TaxID=2905833 RepID=UPI001EDF933C|nr:hypothetical protein [Paenibacillus sp. L3-i20]GKU79808.1 hypothetical protein L3i20_v242050 [Paenibacillus sp. L3-i20]